MKNIKKAVDQLNNKLFEMECEHDYFTYLEYVETPIGCYINFQGQSLWDSENDPRQWVNDDEQEPLEDFLISEIEKFVAINKSMLKALKTN